MKTFNIFVTRLTLSCSLLLFCVARYWCTTLRELLQHSSDVHNAGELTQNQCCWRVSYQLALSSVLFPDAVSRPYSTLLQTEKIWEQISEDQEKYAYTLTRKILHRSKEIFLSVKSWILIVERLLLEWTALTNQPYWKIYRHWQIELSAQAHFSSCYQILSRFDRVGWWLQQLEPQEELNHKKQHPYRLEGIRGTNDQNCETRSYRHNDE